jgi:polysaccharide biosynthesis/export protein
MRNRRVEETTMTSRTNAFCGRAALISCMLLSSTAWAQSVSAKSSTISDHAATADAHIPASPTVAAHDDTFIIGKDDVLAINVWKEPDISRSIPVRSDGKISLPLVGEIQAAGETPLKLEQNIATRLKSYIEEPEVTVIVQQINSEKFNILGMVSKPGTYPLVGSATVLDAIALAGGFRDFAKQKSVYILRQNPDGTQSRLPFNYKEVTKGRNTAQNVQLQPRDTVIVP